MKSTLVEQIDGENSFKKTMEQLLTIMTIKYYLSLALIMKLF